MNRQYRLVWSKRLHMRVAVSETARAEGKSASGESLITTAAGAGPSTWFARAQGWPRALAAVGIAAALWVPSAPTWASGLPLPSGSILDINNSSNGNSGNSYRSGWASYSLGFTPTQTGNNYVLFAFRQDPAFWTFGQVSLTAAGDTTNLFTNPNFATGGSLSAQSGLQAPGSWGIVYQSGTTPYAAGSWQSGFNGDASAGSWYDGAVGSFDGIYQGVSLTAGTTYTIGFSLFGDNPASAARGIEMGVFAGACVSLTSPVADCTPSNPGFVALATPGDTANAGNPATDIDSSAPYQLASNVPATVNPVFDGGTLRMDASPTQDFTITGNGGTIDQAGASSTLSGVLSDATSGGSLTITNSGSGGSVTLTGANTYTGSTTIDSGATLALSGAGSIASSSGVVDNGTLDISGTNAGASVQTLSGNGSVNLGAQDLTLTNAHDTFAGVIAGSGGVTIAGGSETLSGANTYSGGTSVRGGASLSVGSDANLGATSGGLALDDGTLQTSASFASGRDITLGAGGGTIDTAAATTLTDTTGTVSGTGGLTKGGAGTLVLGGTLTQTGGTIVDAGTLVLSGNNTYTGGTTVNNGATLQVSADANLGATSNNPLTLDGGTLENTASFSTARDITLGSNGGTFAADAGTTLALTGSFDGTGTLRKEGQGAIVVGGVIAGPGGVAINAGSATLTASNTYAGGTTIATGASLMLSGAGSIASSSGLVNNGTLDISGTNAGASVQTLSGNGSVNLGGQDLTLTSAHDTFAGTIAGSGGVTIAGGSETLSGANTYSGGTSVRGGASLSVGSDANLGASTGGISLDGGTLQTTASFTSGRDITLGAGGGTVETASGTTLADNTGTISGTGGLAKAGAGTLVLGGTLTQTGGTTVDAGTLVLSGNNTYIGGTTVNNGATLQVSADANLGATINNPLTLDGGTLQNTASFSTGRDITLGVNGGSIATSAGTTLTEGGTISGTAGLTQSGNGTLVLAGTNTYSGGTTVVGGTLQVGADANLGEASGGLRLDGGTLEATASFATGRDITLAAGGGAINTDGGATLASTGAVDGSGILVKEGAGTLSLDGTLSHTGGTVANGGTLVLSGNNTYSGGTLVDNGATLQVAADANLGSTSGNPLALNGGTLHTTGSFASGRDIALGNGGGTLRTDAGTALADTGAVSGAGSLVKDGAGTLSLSGPLSQTGGTVVNGGTLALSGTNSYSGGTTVNNGATLQVWADTNLGDTTGNPLALNGGTLQASASFASARDIALGANGGTIATDALATLTQSGVLSGAADLNKTGAGTLTLGAANTYSGTTTIAQGTLALTGNGSIAASSGVVNDGTLDISATTAGASVRTLSGTGSVALGGQTLILADASDTFSGTIGGSGGVTIAGGTETLSGSNTYAGGTTVGSGATVRVGSDANLGAASGSLTLAGGTLQTTASFTSTRDVTIAGNASFDIAGGTTFSNASGHVTGNGALVKNGSGELDLGGSLSHTGGTVVNDGVLKLSGANTYTGGNTLNGGTLQVSADSNLGAASNGLAFNGGALQATSSFSSDRAVTLSPAGGTFSTDTGATLTLNGALSGSGAVTKEGSGTLVLAGDSAGATHQPGTGWTGGLTVNSGLVQVTNAWGLGWGNVTVNGGTVNTLVNIQTGQTIAFAAGSSIDTAAGTVTTLSGTVGSAAGGSGCFVKSGLGTLNMTGSAVLANGTCVQQGVLRANGTLTSNVTVDAGATLGGAGMIQGTVDVHGTLSPGNSPGYLSTTGTVTMAAGSTYQEDIAGTTQASPTTPVGASGYYSFLHVGNNAGFVIDPNSTLAPMLKNIFTPAEAGYNSPAYTPALGDSFRIVTADGGISGRFGTLAQPDGLQSGTRLAAFYNVFGSNSIDLVVLPQSYAGWLAGSNGNTRSVAQALDSIAARSDVGAASTAQDQLLYVSAHKDAASLPGYAKALAGEIHGALAAVAPQAGLAVTEAVGRQLAQAIATDADVKHRSALWIEAGAHRTRWSSDDTASGFTGDRSQFTVGADVFQKGESRIGLGFSHASTGVHADLGSGNVTENIGFLYGQNTVGSLLVDGIAAYGRMAQDSQRSDPTGLGVADLASAAKGRSALVSAGVRAPWKMDGATIAPFARMTVQNVVRDAAMEAGDSPAALTLERFSATGTRLVGGLSGESAAKDPLAAPSTWQYSAGLGVDAGALARPVVQASLAGVGTQVSAPEAGRVFLQLAASGTARLDRQSYLYYGLSGDVRKGRSEVGVNAGLRVAF